MSLCVAICTRNRPAELSCCLRSVLQSPLVDEVIASSDGVDRETDAVVREAQRADKRVRFVRGPRVGLAANRNACVSATESGFVHFLDDDARLSPAFLPAALPLASDATLVTGWEVQNGRRILPHHPDFLGFQRVPARAPLRAIVINATVFPTSFLRAEPFDEFYRFGSEELDIAMRAVWRGLEIVSVEAGNEHLHVGDGRAGNERAATRSRVYFSAQRYGRYEPSVPRLLAAMVYSASNAIGHGLAVANVGGALDATADVVSAAVGAVRRRRTPRAHVDFVARAADPAPVTGSVVVATYRRAEQLRSCIEGLRDQSRAPEQIIVVRRDADVEAAEVLRDHASAIEEVVVRRAGQVAALRAGAGVARGDVVAFIDDDAVPRHDWLERLLAPYSDPAVLAVGGRDVVHHDGALVNGSCTKVGRLSRFGRLTGNHHLGAGWAQEVDMLKGCNCSYRRADLRVPIGLRGEGAQVANDMATSLRVSSGGGRVIYEPRALVDHYPGPRYDGDGRSKRSAQAVRDGIYNQTFVIASVRPELRRRRLMYLLLVGDRTAPGLLRSSVGRIRGEHDVYGRFVSTAAAVAQASRDAKSAPLSFESPCGIDDIPALDHQVGAPDLLQLPHEA